MDAPPPGPHSWSMRTDKARSGLTLLELLLYLCILAVLFGLAAPAAGRALDRLAVVAARDALSASLARARAAAVARGGARLVVDTEAGRCWVQAGPGIVGTPLDLAREFRVRIVADGSAPNPVVLRFDALGIGRMTSRTFRLRRGSEEGRLTVSAYGRARRW